MQIEDFERMQRELHRLHKERDQLQKMNFQQVDQLAVLRRRIEQLQQQSGHQPLHLIIKQLNPLSFERRLEIYEHQLEKSKCQITFYSQLCEDKSKFLADAKITIIQLSSSLKSQQDQLQMLKHQVQAAESNQQRHKKQIQMWQARLKNTDEERWKLIEQKEKLQLRLKEEEKKNYTALVEAGQKVREVQKEGSESQRDAGAPCSNQLSQIIAIQQEELQERNIQISRLKAINGNYGESNEVLNLKNTIKHLRKFIRNHSEDIRLATDKLVIAQKTISKYEEATRRCNQSLNTISQFHQRIQNQNNIIASLKTELGKANEQLLNEQKRHRKLKESCKDVLIENSYFHDFLFNTYGENFKDLLTGVQQQYQVRLKARMANEKWASLDELISVNQNLRKKLQIS